MKATACTRRAYANAGLVGDRFREDNLPVTAMPCHPPLHKEGLGKLKFSDIVRNGQSPLLPLVAFLYGARSQLQIAPRLGDIKLWLIQEGLHKRKFSCKFIKKENAVFR